MSGTENVPKGPAIDPRALRLFCREVHFAPGAALRTKGLLSPDMYLLTEGVVAVNLDPAGHLGTPIVAGPGAPIGEIGFLTGVPATASVTATTEVRALFIDDNAWRNLEQRLPALAVALYRDLASVADGRQSYNLLFQPDRDTAAPAGKSEIIMCRTPELLHEAQRIRYEIYCEELGRSSPHADPVKRIIADELDEHGHVLLAFEDGAPVATLRMNMARDGPLGVMEDLYGMAQSPFHREGTGICTKFIVRKASRLGQSSFRLMATAIEMAQRYAIRHCFIDCIPELRPFYMSLGFASAGPAFLHRENGRSYPLMLDVDRYAKRIARLTGFVLR